MNMQERIQNFIDDGRTISFVVHDIIQLKTPGGIINQPIGAIIKIEPKDYMLYEFNSDHIVIAKSGITDDTGEHEGVAIIPYTAIIRLIGYSGLILI